MDFEQIIRRSSAVRTTFDTYKNPDLGVLLKTEKNRLIFAEDLQAFQVPSLPNICLKVIAQNYKGRPIKLNLKPLHMRTLYDYIDPTLPIEKCVNIDDEYFWKRAYAFLCTDKMLLRQKNIQKDVCWKELALTHKYVELIETTPYEIWIPDKMELISKIVSPYVTELKIRKLQAMRESSFKIVPLVTDTPSLSLELEEEADEMEEEIAESEKRPSNKSKIFYPLEECHHVDLSVLRHLRRLTKLTIEFLPPELGTNYHSRYFDFSYTDMQNLASGIHPLPELRTLRIRRSRMDSAKLSTILEALKIMSVTDLEFYFCQLDDECGESLYEFLVSTECLERLNLSGNYFVDSAIDYISDGIKNTNCQLQFLGLSNNPISEESLANLIDSLLECTTLTHLALSGVSVSEAGAILIAKLVRKHTTLLNLELIATPINGSSFVNALDFNKIILKITCQGCGLSLEDEFKIELLLKRNRYIKANPYILDQNKTEEEILEFVSRTKNQILLDALAVSKKGAICLSQQAERDKIEAAETSEGTKQENISEEELKNRVILYGQSDQTFFSKKNSCKKKKKSNELSTNEKICI